MLLCSRDRRRNQADQRQRPKEDTAEVNEHHEFSLAESAKLDPYGARIDKPRVSLFRIQDSCMSVRAHGIKFAEKGHIGHQGYPCRHDRPGFRLSSDQNQTITRIIEMGSVRSPTYCAWITGYPEVTLNWG